MNLLEHDKFNDPASKIFYVPFDYLQLISFSGEPVTGKLYLRNESENSLIFRVLIPKTPRLKVHPKFGVIESLTVLTIFITVTPSHLITDFDFFKRNYQVLIQTLQRQVTNKNEIKEIFKQSINLNAAVKFWQHNFLSTKKFPHPNQIESNHESHLKLIRRLVSSDEPFNKKPTSNTHDSNEADESPITRLRKKRNAKYEVFRNKFQVNYVPFGKKERFNKYTSSKENKTKTPSEESKSSSKSKIFRKQSLKEEVDRDVEKVKSESSRSDPKSEKDFTIAMQLDDFSKKMQADEISKKMFFDDFSLKVDDLSRKMQVEDSSKKPTNAQIIHARALAYFLNVPPEKIQKEMSLRADDISKRVDEVSPKKNRSKKKKNKRNDSKGSIDSFEISRKTSQKQSIKNKHMKEDDSPGKLNARRASKNRSSQVSRKSIVKEPETTDKQFARRASVSALSSRASQRTPSMSRAQRTSSYNMKNVAKKLEDPKFKLNYLNEIKAKQDRYNKSKKTPGWKYKPYRPVSENKKDQDVSSSKTMDSEMDKPSERSLLASRKNLDPYRIERQYSWDRADLDLNDVVKMRSDSETIKSSQNTPTRKKMRSTLSINNLESDDPDKPRGTRAKKAMLRLEKKFSGSINSKTLSLELKEIMNKGTPSYEEPSLQTRKSKTEPVFIKKANSVDDISEKHGSHDPYENHFVSDFFDRTSPEVKFSLLRHQDIKSMKTKKIGTGDEETIYSKISSEKPSPIKPRFSEVLMELFTNRNKMQTNQHDVFKKVKDNKVKYEFKHKDYLRDTRLEFIGRLGIYTYMRRALDDLEDESPIRFNTATKLSCGGFVPNTNDNFQTNNAVNETNNTVNETNNAVNETNNLNLSDDSDPNSWMRIENNVMLTNKEILIKGYDFLMKNLNSNPYATNPITLSRDYEYSPPGISLNPHLIKCSVDECDIFKADCGYLFQNPTIKGFVSSGYAKQWNGYTVKPKAKSKKGTKKEN